MNKIVLVAAAFALCVFGTANTANAALPGESTSTKIMASNTGTFKIARRCLSIDAIVRKVMRHGFYNIHRIRPKAYTMKMRGYKRGMRYRIKVRRCSGSLMWYEPMPE
jgi:hypothetical protein